MDASSAMRAPAYGEKALVEGSLLARWSRPALMLLVRVKMDPSGLDAILERISELPEVEVECSHRGFLLFDPHLGRMLPGAEICLPDARVSVHLPQAEGLRAYVEGAGMSEHTCIGVPRAALRLNGGD
jgi:hypothetical protein